MSDIIGLDVGVGSIKAVVLSKSDKGFSLAAIGESRTPRVDWIKGANKKKSMEEMVKNVKTLIGELKVKTKKVITCLPEDEVVSRLIRLPPLKENEVMDALKYEAETFVPYPIEEVSIDYEVVEQDESGRLAVFAIAARNELIQSYVKLVKSVGLELMALESPAISVRRVIASTVPLTSGVIVVDMGEKYSDIIAINKGNIYFTRSMSVGGESLTRAISINLGLDMASAEEYKKAYGMKETELEGKIKVAIEPVFANMAEELRKAMALFSEEQRKPVDLLVLSGGGSNLPGLAEALTRTLGVEVQIIQPFMKVDTSRVNLPFDLKNEACRFSIAVGLAMRGEQ